MLLHIYSISVPLSYRVHKCLTIINCVVYESFGLKRHTPSSNGSWLWYPAESMSEWLKFLFASIFYNHKKTIYATPFDTPNTQFPLTGLPLWYFCLLNKLSSMSTAPPPIYYFYKQRHSCTLLYKNSPNLSPYSYSHPGPSTDFHGAPPSPSACSPKWIFSNCLCKLWI